MHYNVYTLVARVGENDTPACCLDVGAVLYLGITLPFVMAMVLYAFLGGL